MRRRWPIAYLTVLALAGCYSEPRRVGINVYRDDPAISAVNRVVFVELADPAGYPRIASRMTDNLAEAILHRGLFRVDVVGLTHPDLRDLELNKREPYTVAELVRIRKALRCDAILFGAMTSYKPYPSTQVGLYLRLVDLKDGKVIWATDDVWDSTDRATAERIRHFYFDHMRDTYNPSTSEIGYMSTDGFQKFVAHEVTQTMMPTSKATRNRELWRPIRKFGREQDEFWDNARKDL